MRWFKHISNAHKDEKMARLVSELGLEGYGFYWLILETVAGQIDDGSTRTSICYPINFWRKITGFSPKKLRKFVGFCSEIGIISSEFSENQLTINMPNIVKYRDEWSRKRVKNSGVTPETLRSKDTDTDTDTDKEYKSSLDSPKTPEAGDDEKPSRKTRGRHVYDPDYEAFYMAYPRKASKIEGERAWLALKEAGRLGPLDDMIRSMQEYARHHDWENRNAKYIPHISTFLNQGRFEEEASTMTPEERKWLDEQLENAMRVYETAEVIRD